MNESTELSVFTCNGTWVGQNEYLGGRRGADVPYGDSGGVSGWLCFAGIVLGVILATVPNSLNFTWSFPLGVVARALLDEVAGSVLFALSFLERNREVMMGEEGKDKELSGF